MMWVKVQAREPSSRYFVPVDRIVAFDEIAMVSSYLDPECPKDDDPPGASQLIVSVRLKNGDPFFIHGRRAEAFLNHFAEHLESHDVFDWSVPAVPASGSVVDDESERGTGALPREPG